jgi:hypothetical protein
VRVIHRLPGRIRIHLSDRSWLYEHDLEASLGKFHGISQVNANAQTGNVLVTYDPMHTCETVILASIASLERKFASSQTLHAQAYLDVAGAGDDPALTRQIEQRLSALAIVDSATQSSDGRVRVRYHHSHGSMLELVCEAARTPVDVASKCRSRPGVETVARTGERSAEIAGFATQKFQSQSVSTLETASVTVAGAVLLLKALPPARNGLRHLFGDTGANLLLETAELGGAALAGGWPAVIVGTLTAFKLVRIAGNRDSGRKTQRLDLQEPPAMESPDASDERLLAGKG